MTGKTAQPRTASQTTARIPAKAPARTEALAQARAADAQASQESTRSAAPRAAGPLTITAPQRRAYRFLAPLFTSASPTSDPADIRLTNRMTIFSLLFPSGALSRARISRRVSLSRVSVSQAVAEMIDAHLLTESGQEPHPHPGKRGTLVRLDLSYWRIVVLDISSQFLMRGAVLDIAGHILTRMEQPVADDGSVTPGLVEDLCGRLVDRADGHVLGIGVATPGILDEDGTVLTSTGLGWTDVPLRRLLEKKFGLPCRVDHDTVSALLGVRLFDDPRPDMIFVQVAGGVGASVLLDDHVVLGAGHAAGEIGHVVVDPDGPDCECGKKGCLESFIAADRLRGRISAHPGQREELLRKAGTRLGQALTPSLSLLDIDRVTLLGPPDVVNAPFIDGAQEEIDASSSSRLLGRHITVRRCEIGPDVTLLGEAVSVLQSRLARKD